MVKSTAIRVGSLVALAVIAAAGVLFLRAIDTGSSVSAAPAAQEEENEQGSGLVRGLEGVAADDQANATDASGNVTVVTVGTDGSENGGISSDSTSNSAALDPGSGRPGSGSSEG